MYEISLVPDVKAELLRKLRMRNLVYLICVIVAAACGGVFLILFGVTGGQGIKLAAQDTEIACRSDGILRKGKCESKYGTAVLKVRNAEELLTIQDQMKNLSVLNKNKVKISRIFGILDVILPAEGDNTVWISELNMDVDSGTMSFDASASASNGIGFRALEAFKKNVSRAYYDYGNYKRYDKEAGEYVDIPSFCITETTDKDGVTYGVYHRGTPGCEAPMVSGTSNKTTNEDEEELEEEEETEEEEVVAADRKDIRIRRSYINREDFEQYRNGNDRLNNGNSENVKGYYFESECLKYGDDGSFDEKATLEACPLLSDDPRIGDSSYGKNSEGELALSFSAQLLIKREVFLSANKHVRVVGPTRQNVTDSYIQVRDMFTEAADKEVNEYWLKLKKQHQRK